MNKNEHPYQKDRDGSHFGVTPDGTPYHFNGSKKVANDPEAMQALFEVIERASRMSLDDIQKLNNSEYVTYLEVKAKRDEYRQRCASANLSNFITPQQDIDGANMEDYCKRYEEKHGLPRT